MDIVEIVRLLRAGESNRTITQVVRCNRRTVAKYRAWAAAHGLLTGAMPTSAAMHRLLAQTLPGAAPPSKSRPWRLCGGDCGVSGATGRRGWSWR